MAKSSQGDYAATISLSRYCSELTPQAAMGAGLTSLSVLKRADEANYLKAIALLLDRTCELLNITKTLNAVQMVDLAMRIGKQYYYLRLEELMYVFQQATSGRYGKDYNRLDAATVMGWLERYDVDERTPIVTNSAQQKADETPGRLSNEQLSRYYQRVAEGKKSAMEEPKRVSDNNRQAQNEARARYVLEKAQGLVEDYSNYEPISETIDSENP